jgi:CelD/BcsL family acetyltransferase involved in cellulose biosynthesis
MRIDTKKELPPMTDKLHLELIATKQSFLSLEPEWNELLQDSPANNIFLTWEWISIWMKCFGQPYQPWLVVVRHPATRQLLGVAPLLLERRTFSKILPYRELSFIGSNIAAPDHLDFIIRAGYTEHVTPAMIDYLWDQSREWDLLRLDGLSSHAPIVPLLLQQTQTKRREVSKEVCPYITLPNNWETYRAGLSKNMRYNLGRYARKLEKSYPGQVVRRQIQDEAELCTAAEFLFEFHQEVRQAHAQTGSFQDELMREFHFQIAEQFLHCNWLRFYLLTVADKPVAAFYAYHYDNVVSFYQTGYSLDWKNYSPGQYLMAYAIEQAINEGACEFDFLRGDEAYKTRWTDELRHDLFLWLPSGMWGQLIIGATAIRTNGASLKHELARVSDGNKTE